MKPTDFLKLANLVGLVSFVIVIVAMMVKVLMSDSDTILVVHTGFQSVHVKRLS